MKRDDSTRGDASEDASIDASNDDVSNQGLEDPFQPSFAPFHYVFLTYVWPVVLRGHRFGSLELEHLWKAGHEDLPAQGGTKMWTRMTGDLRQTHDSINFSIERTSTLYGLYWVVRKEFWIGVGFQLITAGLRFAGPYLLGRLVSFVQSSSSASASEGYLLGFYLFLTQLIATLANALSDEYSVKMCAKARSALIHTTFEHLLKSPKRMSISNGRLLNLVTADSRHIWGLGLNLSRIVTSPLVLVCGLIYIYALVGPSVLVGVASMFLCVPPLLLMAKYQTRFGKLKAEATDSRLKSINTALQGILVLKLFAYEEAFEKRLEELRSVELAKELSLKLLQAGTIPFAMVVPSMMSVLTFVAYVSLGNSLSATDTFQVVALFVVIRLPFVMLPAGVYEGTTVLVMAKRMDEFFDHMSVDDALIPERVSSTTKALSLKQSSFSWHDDSVALMNVDLEIPEGRLVCVVGKVGSGKSALIRALLGELPCVSSTSSSSSSFKNAQNLAYCAQEPFILNASVRDNVLFGGAYDKEWYDEVIKKCCLLSDLKQLPGGDLTEIGARGVTVSGGQKARISLARAVYSKPEVVLLDDVLSAVDAHVAQSLIQNVLSSKTGLLKNATRVLTTHALTVLPESDFVIVMENGKVKSQSAYDGELEGVVDEEEAFKLEADADADADVSAQRLTTNETKQSGVMSYSTYRAYWMAGSNDKCYIIWLVVFSYFVAEGFFLSIDAYLAIATDVDDSTFNVSRFITIILSLMIAYVFATIGRSIAWAYFSNRAGMSLHRTLMSNVVRLPMQFFWENPLGRIINRVSTDTEEIDLIYPQMWQWFLMLVAQFCGVLFLICASAPWFAIALMPISLLYVLIWSFYRPTAVETQRLDAVMRSPMFNALDAVLNGKETIRAFGKVAQFVEDSDSRMLMSHRAQFSKEIVSVWVTEYLEFVGCLVVLTTGWSVVAMRFKIEPGLAGLALAYALNTVLMFNYVVKMSTLVERLTNSVERVLEFSRLKPEKGGLVDEPPQDWPSKGEVEFINVSMRYKANGPLAVKNLTVTIPGGSKVGVCGRTGAGKSSMLSLIFRLVQPLESESIIRVDSIDISSLTLKALRSRIAMVPQSPVLFEGSIRYNLDPLSKKTDAQLWDALQKVELRGTVERLDLKLDQVVQEGGLNFSVGERQLICIARALLKNARLVLCDEITAAVDSKTDAKIQQAIRLNFQSNTVLTIAHRMETIADSDYVMVLEDGRLKEFDSPSELMKNSNSLYRKLVEAAG